MTTPPIPPQALAQAILDEVCRQSEAAGLSGMIPMGVRVLDGDSGSPWRQFNGEEPPPWGMDKPAPADAPAEMISRWERWREIIFDVRAKIDMALSGAVAEASRRGPRLSLVGPMGQPLDKVRPKGVAVAGPDPDGPLGAINLTAVLLRALRQASPAGEDERTRHRRAKVLEGQVRVLAQQTGGRLHPGMADALGSLVASVSNGTWEPLEGMPDAWADRWESWASLIIGGGLSEGRMAICFVSFMPAPPTVDNVGEGAWPSMVEICVPYDPSAVQVEEVAARALQGAYGPEEEDECGDADENVGGGEN